MLSISPLLQGYSTSTPIVGVCRYRRHDIAYRISRQRMVRAACRRFGGVDSRVLRSLSRDPPIVPVQPSYYSPAILLLLYRFHSTKVVRCRIQNLSQPGDYKMKRRINSQFAQVLFMLAASSIFGVHVAAASAANDNWPQWRGPAQNGVAPSANPPIIWSETNNIKWKVA